MKAILKERLNPAGKDKAREGVINPYLYNSKGFTLLEVMISLAIIAIALVVLLHTHTLNIERVNKAKNMFIATLLAKEKIAEIELTDFAKLVSDRGNFSKYEGFSWQIVVLPAPLEGIKKVSLNIFWKEEKTFRNLTLTGYVAKIE